MKDQFTIRYYFNETPHLQRKADNLYPVQLVVYDRNIKKRVFILTSFHFKDYKEYENTYLKGNNKMRTEMNDYLKVVTELAETIQPFSITTFKNKLNTGFSVGESVNSYYERKINELKDKEKFGTASNYDSSLKSLMKFWNLKSNKNKEIEFTDVTSDFLHKYEKFMLETEDLTSTTIGIYLRPLRSIFNEASAKSNKIVYPFHTKTNTSGYKIPETNKTNKALTTADLKKIFEGEPRGNDEDTAKDFFIFAYLSNGMNMMDIAKLKYKQFSGETFSFVREKTKNTTKTKQQKIEVLITPKQKEIIEKHGNKLKSGYVFPIIDKSMTAEKQRTTIQAFTRYINKYLKSYALSVGVTSEISTNWARHSFASILDKNHVSLEFIRQNLGHTTLATTQKYLSSFSGEDKAKNTSILTNFD